MPQTKEAKRIKADVLKEEAAKMTPQQKLERLDRSFGPGVGAKRERARLKNIMEPKKG